MSYMCPVQYRSTAQRRTLVNAVCCHVRTVMGHTYYFASIEVFSISTYCTSKDAFCSDRCVSDVIFCTFIFPGCLVDCSLGSTPWFRLSICYCSLLMTWRVFFYSLKLGYCSLGLIELIFGRLIFGMVQVVTELLWDIEMTKNVHTKNYPWTGQHYVWRSMHRWQTNGAGCTIKLPCMPCSTISCPPKDIPHSAVLCST